MKSKSLSVFLDLHLLAEFITTLALEFITTLASEQISLENCGSCNKRDFCARKTAPN